jgi:hypothetical protein
VAAGDRGRAPAKGMLESAVQRLGEIVDQETQALRNRAAIDLNDFNDRKNHALLELTRGLRHLEGRANNQALLSQLGGLHRKLEVNRTVLKMHLEAVREISTALSDAIRDADSDGTYSQAIRTVARRQ